MSRDTFTINKPNQSGGVGDESALMIEEYRGVVEQVIKRRSLSEKFGPGTVLKGTGTLTKKAVGEASMQVLVPGVTPDGTQNTFAKNTVTIDRTLLTRDVIDDLALFQTDFDVRSELAISQAEKHARELDKNFFIQAIKAAQRTTSPYATTGFHGGSQVSLPTADREDPARLAAAIGELCIKFREKDVNPEMDGMFAFVSPTEYNTLLNNDQLINGEYITSKGNEVQSGMKLKMWGIPIFHTNNAPFLQEVVEGTPGSGQIQTLMGPNYTGDFSDVLMLICSKKCVLTGQHQMNKIQKFYDELSVAHYIDLMSTYAQTPDRCEYAGIITLT